MVIYNNVKEIITNKKKITARQNERETKIMFRHEIMVWIFDDRFFKPEFLYKKCKKAMHIDQQKKP